MRSPRALETEIKTPYVAAAVAAMGVSAVVTQLTLMREMLEVLSGNEMVLGIMLGAWLALMGSGALAGRAAHRLKRPLGVLLAAEVVIAVVPIADVFALRALRDAVFVRGEALGVGATAATCLAVLAPYCVPAGFVLTLGTAILGRRWRDGGIGWVYFLDNAGSIVGGLAFTFVLVAWFDHFQILYFPAVLNLLVAAAVAYAHRRRVSAAGAVVLAAALVALAATTDLDRVSTAMRYPDREVVFRGRSPYGRLVVTLGGGQYDFIENGLPLFATQNAERVEETVHYAMAQRPDARDVLLISGGVSGTAMEILKYGVQRVDYVDIDPQILQAGRKFLPQNLSDPRINVVNTDGRLYVKRTRRRYDVVICDLPMPSTSQINRFYTSEFFAEVKRVLRPGGVLSLPLGEYTNYVNADLARMIASVGRTVRENFANVLIVPGMRIFFVASDAALVADGDRLADRMEARKIGVLLMNRSYLRDTLSPERVADVSRPATEAAAVNRDFEPVLYYYRLLLWLSEFQYRFGTLERLALLVLAVGVCLMRPVALAVFTAGFAASALEMVLLLAFQILYGSLYDRLGWIVTMFMAGLAVGSFAASRQTRGRWARDLFRIQMGLAALACLLPAALMGLARIGIAGAAGLAVEGALGALAMVLAAMVGMAFPLAGRLEFQLPAPTAARLYAADFLGASVGAVLVSTVLIPLLGIVPVCAITGGLCLLSGLEVRFTRN